MDASLSQEMTHILFNSLTEIQVYPIELPESAQTGTATSAAADTITLANHGFITGDKVISTTLAGFPTNTASTPDR